MVVSIENWNNTTGPPEFALPFALPLQNIGFFFADLMFYAGHDFGLRRFDPGPAFYFYLFSRF